MQVNNRACDAERNSEQVIRNELDSGTETSPSRGPEAADTKECSQRLHAEVPLLNSKSRNPGARANQV